MLPDIREEDLSWYAWRFTEGRERRNYHRRFACSDSFQWHQACSQVNGGAGLKRRSSVPMSQSKDADLTERSHHSDGEMAIVHAHWGYEKHGEVRPLSCGILRLNTPMLADPATLHYPLLPCRTTCSSTLRSHDEESQAPSYRGSVDVDYSRLTTWYTMRTMLCQTGMRLYNTTVFCPCVSPRTTGIGGAILAISSLIAQWYGVQQRS
jgi:hypothetical protein